MDARRFFIARDSASGATSVYEVSNGILYILNREQRSGVGQVRRSDPWPIVRRDAIAQFGKNSSPVVEEVTFKVGKYYPSVARPLFQKPDELINVQFEKQIEIVRKFERDIGILVQEIEECFDVVSPHKDNLSSFGFVFENIIHLSSIAVEALFSKIFQDNEIKKGRSTFKEFSRLNPPMRLSDYSIRLPKYPWLPAFTPFEAWSDPSGAKLMCWHIANNKLKHQRREYQNLANMQNALASMCATMTVFVAVFGDQVFSSDFEGHLAYFEVTRRPKWPLHEYYFAAADRGWTAEHIVL